ncbi:hypothetical protein K458DRAFT_293568 [Lentithecium fluviatile CBS 122367]|uniref:Altered inheritance of mitochondria protein 32 n=1 Tax=Lentithecium fluviatile CBS 122367 TaxID=1168545 RepID=A0A6G1JEB5_9PLEO|nr:hypothetical protein K458DRAFT_293568 [Lentithecium fluviatile CBS 122367]
MPPLLPTAPCIRALRSHTAPTIPPHYQFQSALRLRALSTTAPIPHTPICPSPTCTCSPTPPNLDIDRKTPLLHTMASYSQHLLVCTGKDNWSSRIEDETTPSGDFVRGVKGVIGKGGEGFDPFNNVMLTASSFPSPESEGRGATTTTALLFPAFKRILAIPHTSASYSALATAYLKATLLHPAHANLSPAQKAHLTRDPSLASELPPAAPITTPTVLICGHGGRDQRCGILGPILRAGFQAEFTRRGIDGSVGLISHIGGHKYAGNVIIYIPPGWRGITARSGSLTQGTESGLSGTGIWYGRVGPENVEGVVEETLVKGRIITELFRGGITREGRMLGRMLEEQIKREGGEEGGLKLKPRARR